MISVTCPEIIVLIRTTSVGVPDYLLKLINGNNTMFVGIFKNLENAFPYNGCKAGVGIGKIIDLVLFHLALG